MSGPTPGDVGSDDLYDRFGPTPLIERTDELRDMIGETIRNPDDASGWPAILIPALASAFLINYMRRFV